MLFQKCKQTQGKILGGSSKLNNMIHVRGNLSHYVEWFHGLYTKEYIQNQFQYIENNIFHLNDLQYQSILSEAVLEAIKELNFNTLENDYGIGFKKSILTQNNGKRWTTSDKVDTKHILTNTLVEKLLIKNNKCIGVQISPSKKIIHAKKAVIVSAGAFNSPKLLQLSGIGPAEVLKPLDITIIKELPVGKNLQDHVGTGLDLVLFNETQSVTMFDIMNFWNVFRYFYYGNGPLTTPGCEVIGFVSTKNVTAPNLQYMVLPVGISADRGSYFRKNLGITDKIWSNYFAKIFDKYSTTFMTLLLHPKSRGEVRIQSKNSNIPPIINPNYLHHKDDLKILVDGLKMLKKVIETKTMKSISAQLNNLHFPGCEHYNFFSDDYLECYVRHLTLTSFHPVGTCAMGLPESKNSVVDTSFKVIGIDNLYVVDSSVLPTLPSGNINAAIAMIANIFFENTILVKSTNKSNVCDSRTLKEAIFRICVQQ